MSFSSEYLARQNRNLLDKRYVCLILVAVILFAYWQVHSFGFVNYDDNIYVTDNPHVRAGLNRHSISWAFTTTIGRHWHPLTWLSHLLDSQLFGLAPGWHHLTSVLFHILNTLLLFILFSRMTGTVFRSALVAVLFALHPLNVEPVAWVSARKDVLSCFFGLLTLMAYLRYAEKPGFMPYLLVVSGFTLGLMAKSILVTLPVVLLMLDYWPLGRFPSRQRGGDKASASAGVSPNPVFQEEKVARLILEKVPLLVLAIMCGVISIFALKGSIAEPLSTMFPKSSFLANSLHSFLSYLRKIAWPSDLMVWYPLAPKFPIWMAAVAVFLLVGITGFTLWKARVHPYLAVGWLWYVVTLIPVIGLTKVGPSRMADRYMYFPLIGVFVMIVWGIPGFLSRWRHRTIVFALLIGVGLPGLLTKAWSQLGHWKSSFTLFENTLSLRPDSAFAHGNLGTALLEIGQTGGAVRHLKEAIRLEPSEARHHYNLGLALLNQKALEDAEQKFQHALSLRPGFAEAANALGICYVKKGLFGRAASMFEKALAMDPTLVDAMNNLGRCLEIKGELEPAIAQYQKALAIDPYDITVYRNLAKALARKGDFRKAVATYGRALKVRPKSKELYRDLIAIYLENGEIDAARETEKRAREMGIHPK
jgi:tetratricopeptide (TPR) repeat protein